MLIELLICLLFGSSTFFADHPSRDNNAVRFDSSESSLNLPCTLLESRNFSDDSYDIVVAVAVKLQSASRLLPALKTVLKRQIELCPHNVKDIDTFKIKVDSSAFDAKSTTLIHVEKKLIPSGRLVLSTTGPLNRDFDDVRRYKDAAFRGIRMAKKVKARRILLIVDESAKFEKAKLVAVLSAIQALYIPLQVREFEQLNKRKLPEITLGVWFPERVRNTDVVSFLTYVTAVESAKYVARDIIGGDPERMAPPRVADCIRDQFANSSIVVKVIDDPQLIEANYPLISAVNRAASSIQRHQARVIKLTYTPHASSINKTLLFVGKGITLDTGGLDVKTGGSMIGMSMDKSGAAIVAGFFKALDVLRSAHIQAIGILSIVRNSLGANSYSCDEIIVAKSGRRVRVVNTDAEGRMALLDPLWELGRMARGQPDPHLFTVATLTGHAIRTVGRGYSISLDNGPAKAVNFSRHLQLSSETVGEIIESSVLRVEDYDFHKDPDLEFEDLKQSGTRSTAQTSRGHMTPMAFLIMGAGLDKHGMDSDIPLKYTHIDIAGAEPEFPEVPWGSPLTALIDNLVSPPVKVRP